METRVRDWVLQWFQQHTGVEILELSRKGDENYFDNGYIDSFAFIGMISDIEARWDISFSNDQFLDQSFVTINGLVANIVKGVCKDGI